MSPGSLAWTNLVALIGLVPAAENPQGLGFRFSRFLRLGVGGLSRRLLRPAWPSWSSADARLAKLRLYGATPMPLTVFFGSPGGVGIRN